MRRRNRRSGDTARDIAAYADRKLLLKDGAVIGDERRKPNQEVA
jgi:hypothetical protein